jgi:nucleoporin NUP82
MKTSKQAGENEQARGNGVKVPSYSRKAENEQVQELIQRNSVLVEAATDRLRSLGINVPVEGDS